MANTFTKLSIAAAMFAALTACDPHHEYPDTSVKPGHVVWADGSVSPASEGLSEGKTPVAVIYRLNFDIEGYGKAFAISIDEFSACVNDNPLALPSDTNKGGDEGSEKTTPPSAQGTSTDIEDFNGNSNTFALLTSQSGSPMASYLFSWWHFGQSAYVPSIGQLRALSENIQVVNASIRSVGGTPLACDIENSWYWSSTEVAGQEAYKSWLYSLSSGTMHETPKNETHRVRAVITVY